MSRNILIICADQLRADCLGTYGNKDVQTPHIDKLAEEGTVYENHYTVYPVCTPSRYSFLSGMYVHQHGAWTNRSTLPGGYRTFPQLLSQAGFSTACIGKMHMTPTYQDVGYDIMRLCEQNGVGRFEDDYHMDLMKEGHIDLVDLQDQWNKDRDKNKNSAYYTGFGAIPSDLPREAHSTSWICRKSVEEILNHWSNREDHLLYVSFVKPHHPFDPPSPYDSLYNPEKLSILPGYTENIPRSDEKEDTFFDNRMLSETALKKVMAYYYGNITMIDDAVGEILDALRKKNLYDSTLIIFTADHGEYMGFHHMLLKGNHLYDPLVRIPLIIRYPEGRDSGKRNTGLSENIDVAATILAEFGIAKADTMQGINLQTFSRDTVFCEGQYGTDQTPCMGYMIRSKDKKLLVRGDIGCRMFFDLQRDPAELNNEAGNPVYKSDVRRLQDELIRKMLFTSAGVNHMDENARTLIDSKVVLKRRRELEKFVADTFKDSWCEHMGEK